MLNNPLFLRFAACFLIFGLVASCSPVINNKSGTERSPINAISSNAFSSLFDSRNLVESSSSVKNNTINGDLSLFIECRPNCKVIVKSKSSYFGLKQPIILFKHSLYTSPEYILSSETIVEQSWRVPPSFNGDTLEICIFSDDSIINFSYFDYLYEPLDQVVVFEEPHYTFDSHLGFAGMCPENTAAGVEMSGILGYESCIVVPKVTKDGVIVCIHDDSINRTANLDGHFLEDEIMVSQLTYDELLEYDFGLYKNTFYAGEKILLVDDFFAICKKYDMRPIFSTHPGLTKKQWEFVKSLLIKYDLLSKFTVKGFWVEVLEVAYQVFGNEIMGYTGDNVTVEDMDRFVNNNHVNGDCLNLIIETELKMIDYSLVHSIREHGYTANAFTIDNSFSESMLRKVINFGITGFVDDSYCQYGMLFLNF